MSRRETGDALVIGLSILAVAVLIGLFMIVPSYSRWQARLNAENQKVVQEELGRAELLRAEHNRKIRTQEAEAQLEAAKHLKEAERVRAEGAAAAMDVIQSKLAGEPGLRYLHYLFVQGLNDGSTETIYVPTELNLPVLMGKGLSSGK